MTPSRSAVELAMLLLTDGGLVDLAFVLEFAGF